MLPAPEAQDSSATDDDVIAILLPLASTVKLSVKEHPFAELTVTVY
jgi:hypothetical protein